MVALVSGLTMLAADSPKYGLLKGRILDNEKNPLAGAVVVIDSDKLSAVTDLDGFFSFANLSSGNHSLKVTYIGFLPVNKTITVSEESTIDDIVMSDTSRELNEVVVTGVFSGQQRAINAQKNNINITNVVSADCNNLLNQPLRYYQGSKDYTMQQEYYGVKLNGGVKVTF